MIRPSTALTAATHVGSGLFDRVLTVGFEKQSEGNAMWALSPSYAFTPPMVAGAGGFFAPYCRAYIMRSGAPAHIGAVVAAGDAHRLGEGRAGLEPRRLARALPGELLVRHDDRDRAVGRRTGLEEADRIPQHR